MLTIPLGDRQKTMSGARLTVGGPSSNAVKKVLKAKRYCQQPYERLTNLRGKRFSKTAGMEKIEGHLISNFDELLGTERAALLRCQSAKICLS